MFDIHDKMCYNYSLTKDAFPPKGVRCVLR